MKHNDTIYVQLKDSGQFHLNDQNISVLGSRPSKCVYTGKVVDLIKGGQIVTVKKAEYEAWKAEHAERNESAAAAASVKVQFDKDSAKRLEISQKELADEKAKNAELEEANVELNTDNDKLAAELKEATVGGAESPTPDEPEAEAENEVPGEFTVDKAKALILESIEKKTIVKKGNWYKFDGTSIGDKAGIDAASEALLDDQKLRGKVIAANAE